MNVLTVFAHSGSRSFCHAVLERFDAGLREAGHTNEIVDLYAIGRSSASTSTPCTALTMRRGAGTWRGPMRSGASSKRRPPTAGTVWPPADLALPADVCAVAAGTLRRRSLSNLLQMGHCAPTVMQTLLDASEAEAEWLVKLTAGLPGGIGNTGAECGGITASLVMLGLRHGRDVEREGLPPVIDLGHDLLRRFTASQGTTNCRDIRGTNRLPLRCIGVVREAPGLCAQTLSSDCSQVIPAPSRDAYVRMHAHFVERQFHCARAVVERVPQLQPVSADLLAATSPFVGGTVFTGGTCSALTAGVMALGTALGEVERSRSRVLRMIGTMAVGGDAFVDGLNQFNRTMNLGHELARWFTGRFGSTQCRALTGRDFSTVAGVNQYIATNGVTQCKGIAHDVAAQVDHMITTAQPERRAPCG